jgi:release factor glutamine methyltransferase
LKPVGAESATLTAELLIGHILGWSRVQVLTRPEAPLGAEAAAKLQALVRRRLQGEPLQYLTGEQEFYGLQFRVTPAVLIPRPETEILVEQAVGLAAGLTGTSARFLDVGTGSGCIAISVACRIPGLLGCAVDISFPALEIARQNASRHRVLDRIEFLCSDLLDGLSPLPRYDLILSNPPYVADMEYDTLPETVRGYEPHSALFAGESGLEIYSRLLPQATGRLRRGGHLLVEIGLGQADAVIRMMERHEFAVQGVFKDLQGIPRCIVARGA